MKDKQIQNWTKEELIDELKKRNFQYGELSNKFASLKYDKEDLQKVYNIAMQEITKLRKLLGYDS